MYMETQITQITQIKTAKGQGRQRPGRRWQDQSKIRVDISSTLYVFLMVVVYALALVGS